MMSTVLTIRERNGVRESPVPLRRHDHPGTWYAGIEL